MRQLQQEQNIWLTMRPTPHTVLAPPPPVRTGPGTAGAGVDPLAPPNVKVLEGAGLRRAPPVKVRALHDAPRKVGRCAPSPREPMCTQDVF